MFGRKKKSEETHAPQALAINIRDTLFGDMPWGAWGPADSKEEPWVHFVAAAKRSAAGDARGAADALMNVLRTRGLEARHYLQAYHYMRLLGADAPAEIAKQVLGVVLEVPVEGGLDLLAAYADGSSRYFNYTGAGVVMDAPDAAISEAVKSLLAAGRAVVAQIGPWGKPRPAPPQAGDVRLNFLTPSGLHFGQGPFETLANDPMGGPVIQAGTRLMQLLIAASQHRAGSAR